ncbi:hypothetical protein [Agrobacterium sp. CG674]
MNWPVVLQTASAMIAAASFVYGVGAWRRTTIGQKRIDLAIQTIIAFLEVKHAFEEIRSPVTATGEGTTRQIKPGESQRDAEIGRMAFVAIERLNSRSEKFIAVAALRNQHQAYFGKDNLTAFDKVEGIRRDIFKSSLKLELLWKRQGQTFRTEQEREKHLADMAAAEAVFWETFSENDPVGTRIDALMSDVEKFCREIIEPRPTFQSLKEKVFAQQKHFWSR